MTSAIGRWRHVFKLDPAKSLSDEAIRRICASGTDAVIVGGTDGVTYVNSRELLTRIREACGERDVTCVQELSDTDAAGLDFDLFLAPVVLNAGDPAWIVGAYRDAVKRYGAIIPWERIVPEGYVILNPLAKAARRTSADTDVSLDDVLAYAGIAEHLFRFPIFYMEYSGTFGRMDWVRRAAGTLQKTRLFYGGGIANAVQARQAAAAAHTVVVGNALYRDLDAALETVAAVRSVPSPDDRPPSDQIMNIGR